MIDRTEFRVPGRVDHRSRAKDTVKRCFLINSYNSSATRILLQKWENFLIHIKHHHKQQQLSHLIPTTRTPPYFFSVIQCWRTGNCHKRRLQFAPPTWAASRKVQFLQKPAPPYVRQALSTWDLC